MSSVSNGWLYPSNGHRQLALLRILRQDAFNLQVWGSQEEQHMHLALLPRKSGALGALGWIFGNCRSAKIAGSGVRSMPWSIGQLGAVDQQVRRSWAQWLGGVCQSLNAKTAPFPSCLFNPCKTTTTWCEWDDLSVLQVPAFLRGVFVTTGWCFRIGISLLVIIVTTFSPVSLNSGIVPSQFRAEFGFVHLDSPIKSQTTRMEQVQPVDPIKSRKGLRMSMCAFCPANLWYLVESPRIASAEFGESSKICIPPENAAQSS